MGKLKPPTRDFVENSGECGNDGKIWEDLWGNLGTFWKHMETCGKIWENIGDYGKIWDLKSTCNEQIWEK